MGRNRSNTDCGTVRSVTSQQHSGEAGEENVGIRVKPLSKALGAEILGIDLSRALDDQTVSSIREALLRHLVILFRRQKLTADDQVQFCRHFGELEMPKSGVGESDQHPNVLFISNVRDIGLRTSLEDGEMMFHTDRVYDEYPMMGATLYAIEVPPVGGNTIFCNCYRVYEEMPEAIRASLDARKALNIYDYERNPVQKAREGSEDAPRFVHPAIRTHPETGKKALYVNRLMTEQLVDMPRKESEVLLNQVFDFAEQPRFLYEHIWQVGDFLMWDNRCTMHARTYFDPNHRRMMRRVAIHGDRPF